MANCCENGISNLGCVGHCDDIETGLTATSTGTYVLSVVGSGGYAEQSFTIGEAITFTGVQLNEDKVVLFKVLNPAGVAMELNDKDCFQVSVKTSLDLT